MTEINLTPLAAESPISISEKEYARLCGLNNNGWSNCQSENEWLAKLHYLRDGFKNEKISLKDFTDKEEALIVNWCKKNL